MRLKTLKSILEHIWQVLIFVCKDRTGTGSMEIFLPSSYIAPKEDDPPPVIEREIDLGKTRIHVKSIFSSQTTLDDAMTKIILRKLSEKNI